MPTVVSSDPDAGIRVAITPSQSAYFAGEPFSVTITFTNTRSLDASPPKPPSAYGHKRGAHSISSAPLSKPPTSPGTPRTTPSPLPVTRSKSNTEAPIRRGLVGKDPELTLDQRRRRQQGKSLSVSIAPPTDVDAQLSQTPSAGPYQRTFHDSATFHRSPLVPSTIPRTDTLALSQHHPHARKQSIVDSSPYIPNTPSSYPPMTPNSSTSSFTGALDSISEGARSSYPNTPTLGSPSIEPASPSRFQQYDYPSRPSQPRHSSIGLGHPNAKPRSAVFPPASNTELILYSYAQLTGSVVITTVPGVPLTAEQSHNLKHIRESLLKRKVVGGGSMDINSSLLSRTPSGGEYVGSPPGVASRQMSMSMKGHGRSSSLTGALLSMLSPSSLVGSFSSASAAGSPTSPLPSPSMSGPPGNRWRSSSTPDGDSEPPSPATPNAASGHGLGLGLGFPASSGSGAVMGSRSRRGSNSSTTHSRRSSVAWMLGGEAEMNAISTGDALSESELPLPTFEVQPAMLAVDLALAPGESKSYTYTVNLPDNLPPTFRGKAIKFSYELVVGLCRAGQQGGLAAPSMSRSATPTSGEHPPPSAAPPSNVSKLMKLPIRLYNHVVVDRPPKPYNLLWPVDKRMDLAMPSAQAKVVENDERSAHYPEVPPSLKSPMSAAAGKTKGMGLTDLVRYTQRLLETLPEPEVDSPTAPSPISASLNQFEINLPPLPMPPPSASPDMDDKSVSASSPSVSSATPPPQSSSSLETSPAGSEKGHGVTSPTSSLPPLPQSPPPQSPPNTTNRASTSTNDSTSRSTPNSPTTPSTTSKDLPSIQPVNARSLPRRPATLDLDLDLDDGESSNGDGTLAGGCREAVEILTRTQKKASYDVTKDGVNVAILTFPKSSYRLGETVSGIVEINERKGRSRVLQLAVFLEAHESLPSSLLPPSANRHLRRTYAEHYSSSLLNTLRTTFSLDIPSDSSPAFQTCVGTPYGPNRTTSYGGIEWKVRLCLLVAVAPEDTDTGTEGVRFKSLIRDGPRGEWGSGWKALEVASPLLKRKVPKKGRPPSLQLGGSGRGSTDRLGSPLASANYSARSTSWTAFFASYLSPSMEREYHDGDDLVDDDEEGPDGGEMGGMPGQYGGSLSSFGSEEAEDDGYDGIKPDLAGGVGRGVDFGGGEDGWRNVRLEMVECEVPVRVWPGNTAFKAMDVVFEV